MRDVDCTSLLQWALPRLDLRWAGFRRMRGKVRKRLGRRLAVLGMGYLSGVAGETLNRNLVFTNFQVPQTRGYFWHQRGVRLPPDIQLRLCE